MEVGEVAESEADSKIVLLGVPLQGNTFALERPNVRGPAIKGSPWWETEGEEASGVQSSVE